MWKPAAVVLAVLSTTPLGLHAQQLPSAESEARDLQRKRIEAELNQLGSEVAKALTLDATDRPAFTAPLAAHPTEACSETKSEEGVGRADSDFPDPRVAAAESLANLREQVLRGPESLAAPVVFCRNSTLNLCLYGRFIVFGVWENQYAAPGVINTAGATQLTTASGYLWFFSPAIMEVPIKMVNFCFESPQSFGVFAAGLSDFGVGIGVRDAATGVQINYFNDPGDVFNTIIDKVRVWPCA